MTLLSAEVFKLIYFEKERVNLTLLDISDAYGSVNRKKLIDFLYESAVLPIEVLVV